MESVIQGRIFKFGDNVNSDLIIPGRYLIYIDREKLGQHAFEMLGEGFPDKLRSFDILVAGRNFGCGSAREQAATAIQGLGIKAVVAASFARTFYRNAINDGLPIVRVSGSLRRGPRRRRNPHRSGRRANSSCGQMVSVPKDAGFGAKNPRSGWVSCLS